MIICIGILEGIIKVWAVKYLNFVVSMASAKTRKLFSLKNSLPYRDDFISQPFPQRQTLY